VRLYCEAVAQAATKGHREGVVDSGFDIGSMDEPMAEEATAAPAANEATATEAPAGA
jgi:small subunit ribosomal protein S2